MMQPDHAMRMHTLFVLKTFLDNPAEELAGGAVHQRTRLGSGTLYPTLPRLERTGWVVSRWESFERPRRASTPPAVQADPRWAGAHAVFASFGRGVPT